ncbi:acyl-CoA dehydrogenase family protein [uncultured Demequina sp.]|uniref:acyl-CoA dehydrogenase family protein n=1 Tax=uncultured Demequina sp. TaxID=693499 RepID=UPI0025FACA1F|nr:acyl-CoA dehydrogenase family protein [uncultured Demequina sp.]
MDFAHDGATLALTERAFAFVREHALPAERVLDEQLAAHPEQWGDWPIVKQLQERAREQGLWNLFLPGDPEVTGGAGLTNVQYAPIAEATGWSPRLGPVAFNCAAPDTGNMEVLNDFGTPAQKDQWLRPLLNAQIRSAFCMTEPAVASSDATNIGTRIGRDGDHYVISGRKWWSTGAMNPEAAVFIVMGKTDPDAERHRQQSMILVPRDAPGVEIVRPLTVFGYADRDHGGHAEIVFDDVRVPADHLIAGEGDGFAIAQARLGPGRIHHCMRSLGTAEHAVALVKERANERHAFGRTLAEHGVVREWAAESRIQLEALRLLVLKTAWLMDTVGNRRAMTEIQAIKIAVPRAVQQILDRAIQLHGGALAEMFAGIRSLRIADGPDEVHLASLGRAELRE